MFLFFYIFRTVFLNEKYFAVFDIIILRNM